MKRWKELGIATIPGTSQHLYLYQGTDDFSIKLARGHELMNTRKHGSEDALGALPCRRLADRRAPRVLIGGLGMGFTLAAVLAEVGDGARVTVAELVPEVVEWNRGPLGQASGYPLNDPRTRVHIGDVAELLRGSREAFDVIALDVDNGPEGFTTRGNDWLYSLEGIAVTSGALRPAGVLAYWSAEPHRAFSRRLGQCGLDYEEVQVYAHGNRGARHTIWLVRKPA
ncbi:spermidine synthase [Elongatibacter sediminis]|uniref:Spermidine synthase n=1 Tax=Elongatibacter sediminis TaxID=3119006 RepID=A0AAW9RG23_9GAMM